LRSGVLDTPKLAEQKASSWAKKSSWYTLGLLRRPRAQRKQAALKLAAEKAAAEAAAAEEKAGHGRSDHGMDHGRGAPAAVHAAVASTKARPWYEASTYLSSYDEWYTCSLPSLLLISYQYYRFAKTPFCESMSNV
jgi:hypothetical protein